MTIISLTRTSDKCNMIEKEFYLNRPSFNINIFIRASLLYSTSISSPAFIPRDLQVPAGSSTTKSVGFPLPIILVEPASPSHIDDILLFKPHTEYFPSYLDLE